MTQDVDSFISRLPGLQSEGVQGNLQRAGVRTQGRR